MNESESAFVAQGAVVSGKYRLDRPIGRGAMGSVWSATHLGLGQPIAIKIISRQFINSPEALRRLTSRRRRPPSSDPTTSCKSSITAFWTMAPRTLSWSYCPARRSPNGSRAAERCRSARPSRSFPSACSALSRAHAAGIIHRDIKPENIFISQFPGDASYVVKSWTLASPK